MDQIDVNHLTFKAYELTHHFFRVFKHVTYKDIPIARAMIFNFYRICAIRNYADLESKNENMSINQKKKLFHVLFGDEDVRYVPYNPNLSQKPKVIFSRFVDVLNVKDEIGIFCDEYVKNNQERPPYINPAHIVPINREIELQLTKKIQMVVKDKQVPTFFRRKSFHIWMSKQLSHIIQLIDGLEIIFSKNNIKGVVQENSLLPMNYLLVHMCKQRKIPTINLQLFFNSHYQLMSMNVDHYITFGQYEVDRMTELGVPSHKFKILGNARFDRIFTEKWMSKNHLAKALNFSPDKLVFLYAEQPIHPVEVNEIVMSSLLSSLNPYSDKIIFVIKKHPRQPTSTVSSAVLKKYPFIKLLESEEIDLYDVISSTDVVFTQFSCVGLEAILFGKPMISINFSQNQINREHSYFTKNPLVSSAKSPEQLKSIVKNLVENSLNYNKSIIEKQTIYRDYIYTDIGISSADRIKLFIKNTTGVKV
ncbi:hypothetical protein V2I71_19860 [Peribacillus frigoritolerans]|uniref:hypothetical protein n=1 Tax=Peribacillus frigoritolerans TaxID=450367 RepID=UPI002ED2AD20|nr:hypothetical protein V2I71_19860 [Peribacillus frigoritolerans]